MNHAFEMRNVTKRYGRVAALDDVTVSAPRRSIIGLVGRNGSGKTTFLRHVTGMVLPDSGTCITLGRPAGELEREELSRIGAVHPGDRFLDWMRVERLLEYVASFHERWDRDLQRRLMLEFELDPRAKVGTLSPGTLQRLALILATCHHPELLLLDEPLGDLDPIARQAVLALLLDRFSSDDMTIVVSSHMLGDIEPIVDRIVCLHEGRVVANSGLDELKERFSEWIVTSTGGRLPPHFPEPFVISAQGDRSRARLTVRDADGFAGEFSARYGVAIQARPLKLQSVFRLLVAPGSDRQGVGDAEAGELEIGPEAASTPDPRDAR